MLPKGRDQALETYIKRVRRDVQQQMERRQHQRTTDNLSPAERQALRSLRQRQDIVIKPADKGSAVVVLSKEDYIKEAERQLSNTTHYLKLNKDLIASYAKEVKTAVLSMFNRGLCDRHTRDFLSPSQPKTARLYLLPKIHKPGNPGRPIVSSNGAPTENILEIKTLTANPE